MGTEIRNNLSVPGGGLESFLSNQNTPGPTKPKAYLNVVFLDEQFRFIAKDNVTPGIGSDFQQVAGSAGSTAWFNPMVQKAPKNGWVFVYLSNESNQPVFFDDFSVVQEHSRISEESHYYPYGLKIGSISAHAYNKLESRYGYQGDFSEEDVESGYDEFALRMYDPQLGKWNGVDPYDEFASPYIGMGSDPVNGVDPDGGCKWCESEDRALTLATVVLQPYPGKPIKSSAEGIFGSLIDIAATYFKSQFEYGKGLLQGGWTGAKSIATFIAQDARKPSTWGNMAMSVGTIGLMANTSGTEWQRLQMMQQLDYTLGSDFANRAQGMIGAVSDFVRNIPNMSANDVGRLSGRLLFEVAATKGMGAGLSRLRALSSVAEAAKGVSVIGPRATYREFAQKIGANFLNVTDEAWTMRKNVQFLQGVVKRGDDVIFSGKFNPAKLDPNSVLGQEIRYLQRHGYSWTDDFSRMIKK